VGAELSSGCLENGSGIAHCRGGRRREEGRDGLPCAASRNDGRRAFAAWVLAQAAARPAWRDALAAGDRLVCEWLLGERGHHGAIDPAEGVVYRIERGGKVIGLAKHVRAGKLDGCYLADETGGDHVWNTWRDA
jgi:hypothetical protein